MKRIGFAAAVFVLLAFSFGFAGPESTVSGTYVNKAEKEYLTLYPDGTFHLKLRKRSPDLDNPFINASGKYKVNGEEITLELQDGGEASGRIQGDRFIDNEGVAWMKDGKSEPMQVDPYPKKSWRQ
ncbi:MAG TPA: hypothetical protein PKV86_03480 [Syntrophobacteraceae bacterium]|nr:hypothetical protein [Syntrophobacteraceae bacterium]